MAKSFDHLARVYAPLERLTFGQRLEQARLAFIADLSDAQRILILGEGDGRFLSQLVKVAPSCRIDVVERSPAMIEQSQRRLPSEATVRFICQDANRFTPDGSYDAIVTCFFLDCLEQKALQSLVPRLAASLRGGGLWLYSDFCRGHGLSGVRHRLWLALLYAAFGAVTDIEARKLCDPRPLFRQQALACLRSVSRARGLLTSELWQKRPG